MFPPLPLQGSMHIYLYFSGADVGALDSKKYTPLMVAAAWKNDGLFREMMDGNIAAVQKTLFQAAYSCDATSLNFLRVNVLVVVVFFCWLFNLKINVMFPMLWFCYSIAHSKDNLRETAVLRLQG